MYATVEKPNGVVYADTLDYGQCCELVHHTGISATPTGSGVGKVWIRSGARLQAIGTDHDYVSLDNILVRPLTGDFTIRVEAE